MTFLMELENVLPIIMPRAFLLSIFFQGAFHHKIYRILLMKRFFNHWKDIKGIYTNMNIMESIVPGATGL